jgi:REP element-mobilizing transposase RayT
MPRYKIAENGIVPHFLTSTVVDWLPLFTSEPFCRIITDSLGFCRQNKGMLLHAYVIMPTHLHLIMSAKEGHALSGILRDFRRFTSRAISEQLQADGNQPFLRVLENAGARLERADVDRKVWAEDTHAEALVGEQFFMQKLKYLHENPVRKELVAKPEDWYYSSASAYILGRLEPLEVDFLG